MSLTSITPAQIRAFMGTKKNQDELACKNVRGFHLRKKGKQFHWRVRLRHNGRYRVKQLGSYYKDSQGAYAQKAVDFRTYIEGGGDWDNEAGMLLVSSTKPKAKKKEEPATPKKKSSTSELRLVINEGNAAVDEEKREKYPPIVNNERKVFHYDRLEVVLKEKGIELQEHHKESLAAFADALYWYEYWTLETSKGVYINSVGDRGNLERENPAHKWLDKWEAKLARYRKEFGLLVDAESESSDDEMTKLLKSI